MVEAILTINERPDGLVARSRTRLASLFRGWDDVGADVLEAVEDIAL